jgi:hypothetical protein
MAKVTIALGAGAELFGLLEFSDERKGFFQNHRKQLINGGLISANGVKFGTPQAGDGRAGQYPK